MSTVFNFSKNSAKNRSTITILDEITGFLNTPNLWWSKNLFDLEAFELPAKIKIIKNEILLQENLEHIFVLGKRVERFFEYQIRHSKHYDLKISNLQVIANKQTLGELDFIVEEKNTRQLIHIELVYKFYVYDPGFKEELARWIGPNRKDSLLEKVNRLKTKQLPLLQKKATQQILNGYHISTTSIEQQVCYKASLFIPRNLKNKNFLSINNDCIVGFWIHFEEFTAKQFDQAQFYSPGKQFWPVDPSKNELWFSYSKIFPQIESFIQQQRSPLVWMKSGEHYEKFFIVWW